MTEPSQLSGWVLLILSVAAAMGIRARLSRSPDAEPSRLAAWAVEWLAGDEEVDDIAAEVARIRRRERLRSDVERLQRLIATDTWMSATRQLGNRMAYAQLIREVEEADDLWAPSPTSGQFGNLVVGGSSGRAGSLPWAGTSAPVPDLVAPGTFRSAGTVEVLELGRRR